MTGDWKKGAQKKKAQDEAIDHCFTDADRKKSLSDAKKQQEALECSAKVLTMSPKDLEAWNAAHAKEAPPSSPPASPPPSPEATLYTGLEGCDRESKKAKNPEEKREFLDYCHTKVVQEYERAFAINAAPAQVQRALQPAEALKAFAYDEMHTSEIPPEVRPAYAPTTRIITGEPAIFAEDEEDDEEALQFEAATPTREGAPKLKGQGQAEEALGEESIRTYSTSLRVPESVKARIERLAGSRRSSTFYKVIGAYERIVALGVQELCKNAVALLEMAPAARGATKGTSHCHPVIRDFYIDLYQTPQVFYTRAFREQYEGVGRPNPADPAFRPIFTAYPDLEQVCTKLEKWGTLTLEQTKKGWSYLLLTIPNPTNPMKPRRLIAPPRSAGQLRQWAAFYGRGASKLEESLYAALHNSFRQMVTLVKKLFQFQQMLQSEPFSYTVGNYLLTGYLPFHVRYTLAKRWGVTPGWVRDLTFGWRRKLDAFLPNVYQMQMGSQQSTTLRKVIEQVLASSLTKQDQWILTLLERRSMLHRLFYPEPVEVAIALGIVQRQHLNQARNLHARLQGQLGTILPLLPGYTSTMAPDYGTLLTLTYPGTMALTPAEFKRALSEVKRDTLEVIRAEKGQLAVSTDPSELDKLTFYIERKEAFVATCDMLNHPEVMDQLGRLDLFEVVRPLSKQFHACATVIERLQVSEKGRTVSLKTKLEQQVKRSTIRGVLGAILARACLAQVYPGRSVIKVAEHIASLLTSAAIITPPFCSPNWSREMFPLELPMNPEFLLYREAPYEASKHGLSLTELLRARVLRLPPTARQRGRVSMLVALPKGIVRRTYEAFQRSPGGRRRLEDPEVVQILEQVIPQTMTEFKEQYPHLPEGLPMEAPLTPEMEECLSFNVEVSSDPKQKGETPQDHEDRLYPVSLVHMRMNPPLPASYKLVANLVFEASPARYAAAAFAPAQNYYETRPREYGEQSPRGDPPRTPFDTTRYRPLEPDRMVGVDINRTYSRWLLACATPEQQLDVVSRLGQPLKLARKLRWYRYQKTTSQTTGLFAVLERELGTVIPADLLQQGHQAATVQPPLEQADQAEQVIRDILQALRDRQDWRAIQQVQQLRQQHEFGIYAEIQRVQRALNLYRNDLAELCRGRTPFQQVRYRVLHRHFRTTGTYQDPKQKGQPDERWGRYTTVAALESLLRRKIAQIGVHLTLLHRRKGHVKAALDRETELALTRILIDAQADGLAVEDLQLSTRGRSGAMAKIVTDIPKRPGVTEAALRRLTGYHTAGTGRLVDLIYERVDPRGTSKICGALVGGNPCGEKLRNIPASPDRQVCPVHGQLWRHPNSAQRISQLGAEARKREGGGIVP